jgi:hypothetical protein
MQFLTLLVIILNIAGAVISLVDSEISLALMHFSIAVMATIVFLDY